ncbi:MAG: hypothetical protein IIV90_06820, partial [Oscillospiraceae bacterium]|nr:hypothetical protein [Oscillospiraceae bacterium]
MKRLLLWLLMVILLTALLVGGTIGFFYYKAGSTPLPGPEIAWGESQVEEPVGWQWDVPVLWGAYQRRVEEAPSLTVTKLGSLSSAPALTVPEWVTRGEITIKDEGGAAVFDGGLEEYAAFAYPANGQYQAVVRLWHDVPGERPAQPQGWYQYNLRFDLNAVPSITFSKASVSQGTVIGVKVTGVLGNETPQSECDLG